MLPCHVLTPCCTSAIVRMSNWAQLLCAALCGAHLRSSGVQSSFQLRKGSVFRPRWLPESCVDGPDAWCHCSFYTAVQSARSARICQRRSTGEAQSLTQHSWTEIQPCPQLALTIQSNSNLLPYRPLSALREAMASKWAALGALLAILSCTLPG